MRLKSLICSLVFMFLIGGIGGIFMQRSILPWLAGLSLLSEVKFLEESGQGTTVINKTENVIIEDNKIIKQAIEKVSQSVFLVEARDKSGKTLARQSGVVLTNDGEILTVNLKGAKFFLNDGKNLIELSQIKKDAKSNLILFKAAQSRLSPVPFVRFEDLALGDSVFLVGARLNEDNTADAPPPMPEKFVNLGNIREIGADEIILNMPDDKMASGAPLFNNKGEFIGISSINSVGEITVIDIRTIKEFLGN